MEHQNPLTTKDTKDTKVGKTRIGQRAEALLKKIGEACDELDRLAEENPELVGGVTRGAEEHKDAYLRLKARLALADQAPRCRWVKQDGTGCGSPQMKKHIYCFAHKQMMEAQALALRLPALEDANAIQIGIMRIQKALIDDAISTKKAGLMLYSMQLALQNVGQVTFGQVKKEELVRETVSVEQAVREDVFTAEDAESAEKIGSSGHRDIPPQPAQNRRGPGAPDIGPSEKQNQQQKPLTTEGTEGTEEGKTSPRIDTDGTDQQELEEEFVALPGGAGYRFTRSKIVPDGIPPRAALPQPASPLLPQSTRNEWGPQNRRGPGTPVIGTLPEGVTPI